MNKQKKLQMLDELGRKVTDMVSAVEIASKMHIKLNPTVFENRLLESKNIINKLKFIEMEEGGDWEEMSD